jgi:hypothetical protein
MKVINYFRPLIEGRNNKISIRRTLALVFSVDLVRNISHVIHKWELGKSLAEATMLLGLEAGLVAALLSLTTYQTIAINKNNTNQTDDKINE